MNMKNQFLTLPLQLDLLTKKTQHPRTNLKQSIAQNLHLLLTTGLGELGTDEFFGSLMWEKDFSNFVASNQQKEDITKQIVQAINQYEPRLENIKIMLFYEQDEIPSIHSDARQVKKKFRIEVKANVKLTNDEIIYHDSFF
ncbi:MAG: hypothetical protein DI598_14095, partial [Pseudopedobacter saltans]